MATRRGFLQMLGGAFVAPLMPNATLGAATKAAYPASALHAAIYHATSRVNFSVFSLARQLGLDFDQAEALMTDMSDRGILGPLQGTTQTGRWALSKVWEKPFVEAATTRRLTKRHTTDTATPDRNTGVKLDPLLAYLRKMAQDQGFELNARCHATA